MGIRYWRFWIIELGENTIKEKSGILLKRSENKKPSVPTNHCNLI